MGRAADAIREDDAHWATVSRLSQLIDRSSRRRRRRAGWPFRRPGVDGGAPGPPSPPPPA